MTTATKTTSYTVNAAFVKDLQQRAGDDFTDATACLVDLIRRTHERATGAWREAEKEAREMERQAGNAQRDLKAGHVPWGFNDHPGKYEDAVIKARGACELLSELLHIVTRTNLLDSDADFEIDITERLRG